MLYHFHMRFEAIPWSYLAGWIAMIAFEIPYLILALRKNRTQKVIQ